MASERYSKKQTLAESREEEKAALPREALSA